MTRQIMKIVQVHLSPFTAFWFSALVLFIQEVFLKRKGTHARKADKTLQFAIILEGALIIYDQLSDLIYN